MPNTKKIYKYHSTGVTVHVTIEDQATGYLLDASDGAFKTLTSITSPNQFSALTEAATQKGKYELSEARAAWTDGQKLLAFRERVGSSGAWTDPIIGDCEAYYRNDAEVTIYDVDGNTDAIKTVTDKILFDGSNFVKAVQQGAVDILQTAADKVWGTTARSLTTFGSLTTDTATAVWANSTRTLSSFGTLIADVWANATRSLTDKAGFSISGTIQTLDALNTALHADHVSLADSIAAIPTTPLLTSDTRLNNLDAKVSDRPTLAQMEASTVLAKKSDVSQAFITVLPFSGSMQTAYARKGATVEVVQGDSVSIPYDLATDLTGFTVWFGAKAAYTDSAYAIAAKAAYTDSAYAIAAKEITGSLTDVINGRGLIPITAAESNIMSGPYIAEIELRKDTQIITAMQFTLNVRGQVIS